MENKGLSGIELVETVWDFKKKLQENLSLLDLHNNGLWDIK